MTVSEFESRDAGKPVERLKELYSKARENLLSTSDGKSVLIIDDIDTAIGNWGSMTQYTVNTQIIVGELMQIASDKKERKVPIIITGNDFSKIYYPLRRSGRMTSIYWEPSGEERLDSVQMLFPWLPINDCKKYIFELENFAKEIKTMRPPISFYSTIKSKIFDDVLWKQLLEERQKTMDTSYIDNLAYINILISRN